MEPLRYAPIRKQLEVIRVIGLAKDKKLLENLGIISGTHIVVLTNNDGNLVVRVKESRVALNQELSAKIMIKEVG